MNRVFDVVVFFFVPDSLLDLRDVLRLEYQEELVKNKVDQDVEQVLWALNPGKQVTRVFEEIEVQRPDVSQIRLEQALDHLDIKPIDFEQFNERLSFKILVLEGGLDADVEFGQVLNDLDLL